MAFLSRWIVSGLPLFTLSFSLPPEHEVQGRPFGRVGIPRYLRLETGVSGRTFLKTVPIALNFFNPNGFHCFAGDLACLLSSKFNLQTFDAFPGTI